MKILVIGDIHGQEDWIIPANEALSKFIKIIFVGDYVDSYTISPSIIKNNLKTIIEFKKKHEDEVTLLLGNHDWAYIHDCSGISGFNFQSWQDYKKIFQENIKLFDIAWGYTNHNTNKYTLITHAGLTKTYFKNYIHPDLENPESKLYKLCDGNVEQHNIHDFLNYMIDEDIVWKVGNGRGGVGVPGPLWADHRELLEDPYPYINQIFGHTAIGPMQIDQIEDYFLAKVDGSRNKNLNMMVLNI